MNREEVKLGDRCTYQQRGVLEEDRWLLEEVYV